MPGQVVYSIPVIQQGLAPSESLFQMLEALENLDGIVQQVFGTISTRITEEKNRLSAVNTRIETAKTKIDSIIGTNQALTVFSPAQYPTSNKLTEFTPVFDGFAVAPPDPKRVYHKQVEQEKNSLRYVDSNDDLREFAIARQNEITLSSDHKEFNIEKEKKEGLGRLPNISSVSSLLLFNSNINLYKSYVIMNNLATDDNANANLTKKDTVKKLGEAPKTVSDGDVLPEIAGLNYYYEPVLGDVPQFNLPNQLPNLPGVANINWSAPDLPEWSSVVPSNKRATLANLPAVDINATSTPSSNFAPLPNIANPPDGATPPPPPRPPGQASPPPPPPPTQSGPSLPLSGTDNGEEEGKEKPAADGGDPRNMLLEQIRHPGMKLKSTKERKDKEEGAPSNAAGGGSGGKAPRSTTDLFGDLLNALKIRRQGMQGNNEAKSKPDASAEKIEIPPIDEKDWDDES